MLAGAGGSLGHGRGHTRRATLRDDHAIGAGGIGGAKNRAQIVRIFNSIQHHHQTNIRPRLAATTSSRWLYRLPEVIATTPWWALFPAMLVEFGAGQKAHRHAVAPAFLHHALQTQVMTLFQYANPFERSPARLQRFGDSIDPVDVIHRV